MMAVSLTGWEAISGTKPSWDDVIDRLSKYSLAEILNASTRISAMLSQAKTPWDMQTQVDLAHGIFRENFRAVLAAADKLRSRGGPAVVLFYEQHLIHLTKVALLTQSVSSHRGEESLAPLGEALLMLTDLVDVGPLRGDGTTYDDTNNRPWIQHIIASALFNAECHVPEGLGRSTRLYLRDTARLKGSRSYLDLPKRFEEITGWPPEALVAVTLGLYGGWLSLRKEAIHEQGAGWKRDGFFGKCDFGQETADSFFDHLAWRAEELQELVKRNYSLENLRPFHVVPFAAKPIVDVEGTLFCPSVKLSKARLIDGWHHIFIQPHLEKKDRKRFLDYMGDVFEEYIFDVLGAACLGRHSIVIRLDDHKQSFHGLISDVVIVDGDAAVVLECKATVLPMLVRAAESWDALKDQVGKVIVKGAGQLQNTLEHLQAGVLEHAGIDPSAIREWFPIIVTLDHVPQDPTTCRFFNEEITSALSSSTWRGAPLAFMDVWAAERAALCVTKGKGLAQLIREKLADPRGRDISFGNYWAMAGDEYTRGPNVDLLAAFEETKKTAFQWVAKHCLDEASNSEA